MNALQLKVKSEINKHDTQTNKVASSKIASSAMKRVATCHVSDHFKLNPADASYHLSIEAQTSIDFVVIQVSLFSSLFAG